MAANVGTEGGRPLHGIEQIPEYLPYNFKNIPSRRFTDEGGGGGDGGEAPEMPQGPPPVPGAGKPAPLKPPLRSMSPGTCCPQHYPVSWVR
jgi:hypothetical protein